MLIVRGINVYPRTIETVLMDDPDTGANYLVVVDRSGPQVELSAKTELAEEAVSASADVADRLEKRLAEVVRLRIKVDVGDPGSVPRTEVGKARRVIDASELA
jgi:phenylacetate-CoA ligase